MFKVPFAANGVRRALVIKLRHHGDVLLTAPVLSSLKRAAPDCEVDALVYADTAPMLEGHPALSRLFLIDRNWKKQGVAAQAAAEWRLLSQLRARKYDLVVHLSVHTRGAWLTRLLRPRWSVAPRRAGHHGERFWDASFTHLYPAQAHGDRHTVDTNLDSLRTLGLHPAQLDLRVVMVPGMEAEVRISLLLADQGLVSGKFVHIHPTSRWSFKCWPAENVAALCDRFAEKGMSVVLTAAPDPRELDFIAKVLATTKFETVNLAGQLSLKELAALTQRARLFVGVDSAPMHIAAAMNIPVVAIFGPSGEREWGPWCHPGVEHRVVSSSAYACRPCGRAGCNDSKISDCLINLPVKQVWTACEELY